MVIDNMENTFITPVFAGSTSVRDAAGTLIENVAKATRRKQIKLNADGTALDEGYLDSLFREVRQLYKLNEIEVTPVEPAGTVPAESGQSAESQNVQPESTPPAGESAPAPETETTADPHDLGPLPSTSVAMIAALIGVWVIMGAVVVIGLIRKHRNNNS